MSSNPPISFLRFWVSLAFCFTAMLYHGQANMEAIDYSRIAPKKVRAYLQELQLTHHNDFSTVEASVKEGDDLSSFFVYNKAFCLPADLQTVWNLYAQSNQTEVWQNVRVSFGMIYARSNEAFFYADQEAKGFSVGNLYFLNLKIMRGLYNLPVSFEILRVDPAEKIIEFAYMKGGKTIGKQVLIFAENPSGGSCVQHQSIVVRGKNIRDHYLYPFFHNRIIKEFHRKMKKDLDKKCLVDPLKESL